MRNTLQRLAGRKHRHPHMADTQGRASPTRPVSHPYAGARSRTLHPPNSHMQGQTHVASSGTPKQPPTAQQPIATQQGEQPLLPSHPQPHSTQAPELGLIARCARLQMRLCVTLLMGTALTPNTPRSTGRAGHARGVRKVQGKWQKQQRGEHPSEESPHAGGSNRRTARRARLKAPMRAGRRRAPARRIDARGSTATRPAHRPASCRERHPQQLQMRVRLRHLHHGAA